MKELNIAKILVDKRREKGVTQEDIAVYIGVSKASVSKWETSQSYPDITFLPQLASYFNMSIDDLIGYEPQMTKEDIKKTYLRFSEAFVTRPFDEVYEECRNTVKKYYSCFPLLLQMAGLYLNHFPFTDDKEKQTGMMEDAVSLCQRIVNESKEIRIARDAQFLKAAIHLYLNQPEKTLDVLGENLDPIRQETETIAHAYAMLGNSQEARKALQVTEYQYLVSMLSMMSQKMMLDMEQPDKVEEILKRAEGLCQMYHIDLLHPFMVLPIYGMAAQIYMTFGQTKKVLDYLKKYVEVMRGFEPMTLRGDDYFDQIDGWIQEYVMLGQTAPRNVEIMKRNLIEGISQNPAFAPLKDNAEFKNIVMQLNDILYGGQ